MILPRLALFLTILTLLSFTVSAADNFEIDIKPIKSSIFPDETASYEMTVKNREPDSIEITITSFSLGSKWSLLTYPVSEMNTVLKGGENRKIRLNLKPIDNNRDFGIRTINVRVEALNLNTGGEFEDLQEIEVELKDPTIPLPGSIPDITVSSNYPNNINPLEAFNLKLTIINNNALNLDNVGLSLRGDLLNAEHRVNIKPYANKTIDFEIDPNRYAVYGNQEVDLSVVHNGEVIASDIYRFNVQQINLPFDVVDFEQKRSFLKVTKTYSVHNPSNFRKTGEYLVPMSFFTRMLSDVEPEEEVMDGSYVMSGTLEPNGTIVYTLETSYMPLLIAFIILIILIGVYQKFRPDIYINRKYVRMELDETNNFISCKVIVHIKNSTRHVLKNVKILEEVPGLARYVPDDEGLSPSKISSGDYKASRLIWEFDELDPKDERILTYYVKGSFRVMGGFDIPPTAATYYKSGERKVIYGGKLRISVSK